VKTIVSSLIMMTLLCATLAAQPVQNGDFEDGRVWWTFSGRFALSAGATAHAGRYSAVFGQRDFLPPDLNTTGALSQSVRIGAAGAALILFSSVQTTETDGRPHDTLTVELADAAGNVLETKAVLSNLDATSGYVRRVYVLNAVNRTALLRFRATTDSLNATIFRLDDIALLPLTTITGTVTDAKSGSPVPGANVTFDVFNATSGADGKYTLRVPCQSATLTATAALYQPAQVPYAPACSGTNVKNIALQPLPTTLSGHVYDSGTKAPIAGVQISRGTDRTVSASDGSYGLVLSSCAQSTLQAAVARYETFQQPSSVTCNTANSVDIYLTPRLTHISVAVASAGHPVDGVVVRWGTEAPITRFQSLWSYQGVVCESRTLTVSAPGYTTYAAPYKPACGITNYVPVELKPIVTIVSGTLLDDWSHNPVANATVTLDDVSATTNESGQFTLAGRRCVPALLKVTAPGYRPSLERSTPSCDPVNVKNLSLTPAPAGTSICGVVTSSRTGDPIANVTMHFGAATGVSDPKGGYCLTPVSCSANLLATHVDGYNDYSVTYSPPFCLKTNTKDVPLVARTIGGMVVDSTARWGTKALIVPGATMTFGTRSATSGIDGYAWLFPVCGSDKLRVSKPGYSVYEQNDGFLCGWGSGGSGFVRTLTPNGTNLFVLPFQSGAATFAGLVGEPTYDGFVFTDVPCVTGTLMVNAIYDETGWQSITPVCGKSTVIYVPLRRNATDVTGRVTDLVPGNAIFGATVTFADASATTDTTGHYRLAQVPCKPGTLTVTMSGYKTSSQSYQPSCIDNNIKDVSLTK